MIVLLFVFGVMLIVGVGLFMTYGNRLGDFMMWVGLFGLLTVMFVSILMRYGL